MTRSHNYYYLRYAQLDLMVDSYIPKKLIRTRVTDTFDPVEKKGIHIGNIIKTRIEKMHLKPISVYKKMKITKQAYYYYIDKPSMDTGMLQRFGEAIGYNFFIEYLPESERGTKQAELLRKQLDACKADLASIKDRLLAQYERGLKL